MGHPPCSPAPLPPAEYHSSRGGADDKQLKWKIAALSSCKCEPLMWFGDNAHWLMWPWGLWHWVRALVIPAQSLGGSHICHHTTRAVRRKKNYRQHFNLFLPPKVRPYEIWGEDERQYCSLWAWLKPVYWKTDYQPIDYQGGRISSYLQLQSSRFKSTANLRSSAVAHQAAAGRDCGRRRTSLLPRSAVITLQ